MSCTYEDKKETRSLTVQITKVCISERMGKTRNMHKKADIYELYL